MKRGEIYKVTGAPNKDPKKRRCFVVVSRQTLITPNPKRYAVICLEPSPGLPEATRYSR